MKKTPKCPFCGNPAEWVENKEIYGRNYGDSYMCWLCRPCHAYVGCHNNGKTPLGTLANKETREWRVKAHAVIDPLWKSGAIDRRKLYKKLNGLFSKEFHIGSSNIEDCKKIIEFFSDNDLSEAIKESQDLRKNPLEYIKKLVP